jgi:hypothetical protein
MHPYVAPPEEIRAERLADFEDFYAGWFAAGCGIDWARPEGKNNAAVYLHKQGYLARMKAKNKEVVDASLHR